MIRRFPSPRQPVRAHRAGFTLVELLTVIAIILVLAGLLLNVASNANYKSSFSRAVAEIKAMDTALESYKADNGAYPRSTDTDKLNAQPAAGAPPPDPSDYKTACQCLYQALSGYSQGTKRYMDIRPTQVSTGSGTPTAASYLVDPFGLSYGYSTANQKAQDTANSTASTTAVDGTQGYNPTFDLWSTGGYTTNSGGKKYPSTASTGSAAVNLWAKNW